MTISRAKVVGTRGSFFGHNEACRSHPSSAEPMNELSCIPIPPIHFQGVCSENFTMFAKTICYLLSVPVCILTAQKFLSIADWIWNVMAHAQKPDFVFRRNGRVHLNRRGLHFSRLLAAEPCASTVIMMDTPCSEVVCRELATHSIRQFLLHFPSRASPCAITFQLDSTATWFRTSQLLFAAHSSNACSLSVSSHLPRFNVRHGGGEGEEQNVAI